MSASGATLTATFAGVRTSPAPQDAGFRYGTSQGNLSSTVYTDGLLNAANGSFSADVVSLAESTTYYYQAFMTVWNGSAYTEITSEIRSFKTSSPSAVSLGYLECYEVPELTTLNGSGTHGTNSDRDDKWFRYYTTNSSRQVATHTFTHPTTSKQVRNYTVLYDESTRCPVWTAHAMHNGPWPDEDAGRNSSWTTDPAISLQQQSGVTGYSKGHLVASNYRQTTEGQNKQTFYYTNQAPQYQNGFNDGVWNTLEGKVKAAAPSTQSDTLYVVTGVLFEGNYETQGSVSIPSHFYKCIMKCSFNGSGDITAASGVAYVFTNESHTGAALSTFKTTIDAIETRAGFDFFPRVPSALQTAAENGTSVLNL